MSKQVTEEQTKENSKGWTNIDYTNTAAYKTVKAFNKVGVFTDEPNPNQPGIIPRQEFQQLKKLRRFDAIVKKQKGPILKIITHMARQLVSQFDQYGKPITKEYLTLSGEIRGVDHADMEIRQYFEEGVYKDPKMAKEYKIGKRFDPETGEDLGKMKVHSTKDEYYLEVPKDKKERIKFINNIIEKANGTFKENIHYYYKDLESGQRDDSFSHEQFCDCSIEELRTLSKRGAGAKGPGFWRNSEGKLMDKDGNLVSQGKGVYQ